MLLVLLRLVFRLCCWYVGGIECGDWVGLYQGSDAVVEYLFYVLRIVVVLLDCQVQLGECYGFVVVEHLGARFFGCQLDFYDVLWIWDYFVGFDVDVRVQQVGIDFVEDVGVGFYFVFYYYFIEIECFFDYDAIERFG